MDLSQDSCNYPFPRVLGQQTALALFQFKLRSGLCLSIFFLFFFSGVRQILGCGTNLKLPGDRDGDLIPKVRLSRVVAPDRSAINIISPSSSSTQTVSSTAEFLADNELPALTSAEAASSATAAGKVSSSLSSPSKV